MVVNFTTIFEKIREEQILALSQKSSRGMAGELLEVNDFLYLCILLYFNHKLRVESTIKPLFIRLLKDGHWNPGCHQTNTTNGGQWCHLLFTGQWTIISIAIEQDDTESHEHSNLKWIWIWNNRLIINDS